MDLAIQLSSQAVGSGSSLRGHSVYCGVFFHHACGREAGPFPNSLAYNGYHHACGREAGPFPNSLACHGFSFTKCFSECSGDFATREDG